MIRKSFTKLKRIIFSGLVMSLCTFVFNPTTPANAAMVQESEPNDDWTTADNLSLNTWVKGTMRRKADDRYYRDKDYYKFTISQTGETSIEVNFPPLISANRNQRGPLRGLFHAQPEGFAETKRIPAVGLLKGLLAVLQFTLLSPGYAVKIPNCPQGSGRSRYPSEDNGHSLSYL